MLWRWFCLILICSAALAGSGLPVRADEAAWRALALPGHVGLMRHARAPGVGDPPAFRVDDCATQRNLDQSGREQARRIGEAFRSNGIPSGRVFSSQWCRARDTARLMNIGDVRDAPDALNSFFEDRSQRSASTAALRALIARLPADGAPIVMVTHQVNITALTGVSPRDGEIVVVRDGANAAVVVGRIAIP